MTGTLSATIKTTGELSFGATLDNRIANYGVAIGSNNFPSLTTTYAHGTGNGEANQFFVGKYTIAAGANQDLDLAGSLVDDSGTTLTFSKIKELIVAIDTPDGTKAVRVGPQGVSNPWQGFWGGTGATVYDTVVVGQRWSDPYAGVTVTGGSADVLRLNNPGGSSIAVHVLIIGLS